MTSEIVYIDTYWCPQCRSELETGFGDWQGWQRCPKCGLPSLPPQPLAPPTHGRRGNRALSAAGVVVISDQPENLADAEPGSAEADDQSSYVSGARLFLRTGLFVSVGLAFIFFLDRRTTNMVIFGFLALAFFLLLARTPARPKSTV